jgi:uncharacterized protein with ATP-grasp and redox domains
MRSEAACIPCVIHQCQRVVKMVTNDEGLLLSVTHRVLDRIQELTLDEPPSRFTSRVLMEAYAALGSEDPFARARKTMNELGAKAAERARDRIAHTPDPLHTAILYAAAGNVIDIGPQASFDLDAALANLHFKRDDYREFRDRLHGAQNVLYLLDNAGEVFLDRLLIERLSGYQLTMVVKPAPILNDALASDAEAAGLPRFGRVITTGTRVLGIDLPESSPELQAEFEKADVIIAKGHANFESLIDLDRDVFFVLKAKCPVVAQRLTQCAPGGEPIVVGDSVFLYSQGRPEEN